MPANLPPITLKKTGYRAFWFGKIFDYKRIHGNVTSKGVIEACYHTDTALELLRLTAKEYSTENPAYIVGVNHLFLRRANMFTRLQRYTYLDKGRHTLDEQMQQLFDKHIATNGEKEINIGYTDRQDLIRGWNAIKSGQAMGELLKSRNEIAYLLSSDTLPRLLKKNAISKTLAKYLISSAAPTDEKVMQKLASIGVVRETSRGWGGTW